MTAIPCSRASWCWSARKRATAKQKATTPKKTRGLSKNSYLSKNGYGEVGEGVIVSDSFTEKEVFDRVSEGEEESAGAINEEIE